MMPFSERAVRLRAEHSISQTTLAKALDVPRSTIWRWETGKSFPSYDKLMDFISYSDSLAEITNKLGK